MKFDIRVWKDYYNYTHELNSSKSDLDKEAQSYLFKQCSKYLDDCGLRMPYAPKWEEYKANKFKYFMRMKDLSSESIECLENANG